MISLRRSVFWQSKNVNITVGKKRARWIILKICECDDQSVHTFLQTERAQISSSICLLSVFVSYLEKITFISKISWIQKYKQGFYSGLPPDKVIFASKLLMDRNHFYSSMTIEQKEDLRNMKKIFYSESVIGRVNFFPRIDDKFSFTLWW